MAKILSDNAMQVFKSRYAFDENEDWSQCAKRVGDAIGSLEKNPKYKDKFQEMIYNMDLLPGGRILRNSGRARGSLLNCMVLSVADSIEAIGQYLKDALILWSEGSGVGCNFSPLRKRGDVIQGKGGVSCLTGDTLLYNINPKKRINERQIYSISQLYDLKSRKKRLPIRIKCMVDDNVIGNNKLVDVIDNGIQSVFEVKTKLGYTIKATGNHRFLSFDGWKIVDEFNIGMGIGVNGKEIKSCTRCGRIRPVKGIDSKYHGICDNCYVSVRLGYAFVGSEEHKKNIEERNKKQREWRSLPKVREYFRNIRLGDRSPMWKGDEASETTARQRVRNWYLDLDLSQCQECKSTQRIEVHHIDANPYNNSLSNLKILCCKCHNKEDHKRMNFGDPRKMNEVYFDEIISIQKLDEKEQVYDIVMEHPYHNFIANGFVSHNSGLCSFIEAADAVAKTVESGGNRRAASLICVDVSHPEVLDFIDAKLVHGKLSHCNISVNINNEFLEAVEADKDYEFKFQQRSYGNMKARNIWDKILSNMVTSAEPGLLNTSNLYKNNSYYFAMPTCFSGDTLISTVDGLIPIKELVDQSIKVVTDLRCIHSSGTFIENGYGSFSGQKELFEILLQNKQKIKLTAEHLVWTQKGWKQVKELIPNKDKMYVQTSVSQHVLKEYNKTAFDNGFLVGYLVGDGWICYHRNNGAVQYGFVAHEDEIEIMKFISDAINLIIGSTGSNREPHWRRSSNGGKSFELVTTAKGVCDFFSTWDYTYKIGQHGYISCDKKSSKFVSDKVLRESTEFKKGFLAGLFAADGHMGTYHNSSSFRISLTSAKKHIIERVQILLNEFGVASSRGSHITSLNGKLFTSYTLNISRLLGNKAFQSFIGFGYSLKQKKLVEYKFQEKWQTSDYGGYLVKSITSIGIQDVYDISTEITHALVANGIVVHNSTNPCFNKGTLIQTKLGPRKIETLIGQNVEIWDGEQWVWCNNFRVTGENQPVLKITLRDKSILEVTPYHMMILENEHRLPAQKLIIGHRLMPSYVPNMPTKDINCHVIEDIKEIGIQEKVYCCTIHTTHKLAISIGILVSNCGEAILEPYGACDLASLVLPNFISDQGRTNWKKLEEVINLAVRFLDNVLDLNKYPIKQIDETCHLSRRIGLGIMGLAEYLFSKKVRYGSPDSISEIEKLMKFIRDTTYIASIELAVEKGSFPKFDPAAFGKASFVRKLPAPLRKEIKTKGIRNVTLLSIAPTGSISLLPEVTSGCEPLFSKAYRRKDRVSERIYIHPIYKNLIAQGNLVENKDCPDWFVDTSDLQPIDHFNVQVVLTKNTCGGVSKTINLPKGTTVGQLSDWLLEYLYDLKGVTVYVDGSREGQVLNHISHEEAVKLVLEGKDTTDVPEEQKCHSGVCEV